MSYSTSIPPQLMIPSIGGGMALWGYKSADAVATVIAAGYFSNGSALGMKLGDAVLIYDTGTNDGAIAYVTAVTAGGSAECTEYQAITT
jgi:hypothetical protein